MMKRSIQDIRRQELIEAAYQVFLEHGFDGLTTARICKAAGMSPGLLVYHFDSKDEVLFWMVRHANRVIMDEVVRQMRGATTPWHRLRAIVSGNFPVDLFNRNTANAWLSFYVMAARDVQLQRLQKLFHNRLSSNLRSCLEGVLDKQGMAAFAKLAAVLIDGNWLHKGGADDPTTAEQAVEMIMSALEQHLGPERLARLKG